ncbi:MAG: hypothetical protein JNM91_10685, partial [Flavobacteriales bacterium]|nr:hypothetical protein [Flavobacteriales bacterium]
MNSEYAALALLACLSSGAYAQSPEHWEALHAQPRSSASPFTRDGGLNTYFIYQYENQTLPIVDDFSVDRTRHLDATPTSPGVTPGPVFYYLQVAGSSTASMAFEDDSTYHVTVDTAGADVFTSVANPSIEVVVFDLSVYPPTTDTVDLWPPYNIRDTVGDPTSDTVFVVTPDLVQDSLLVYIVPPLGGTYTNPDNSVKPLILWEDDDAYINGTYPVEPPSIGVASFDGMDRTGYPYSPENPNQQGIADHLTSVPIDLLGIASDSVYLSFFYQPRGLSGDVDVDPTDSLRLEFYSPSQDRWYLEWSTPYPTGDQPFRQVMVPIVFQQFLQNGFRMRFSNRGTLGGAVDHWHIDYVRLGKQRSLADTLLQDVTFVYPANSLIAPYTSVPYDRFTASPGSYMAGNVDLVQRNLFNVSALITWGYEVSTDCGSSASFVGPGSNIGSNAGTIFTAANPINSAPHDFQYDLNSCSEAAFATTKFWTLANPDALRYNDTTTVVQEISN